MIGRSLAAVLVIVLGITTSAFAADTQAPEGFCSVAPPILVPDELRTNAVAGSPFSFAVTWDASVPASWRTVIQQAMTEWQNLLTDNGCSNNPLPVYIRWKSLPAGTLAQTQPFLFISTGCVSRDTINFDGEAYTWFVDPTPADDSEFVVDPGPDGYDLLSVARHELGHAVGWTQGAKNQGLMSNDVFDPNRVNALTTTAQGGQGWHCDNTWLPNDLMVPTTGQSERRSISFYPDVVVAARSYDGGCPIGMVDPSFGGVETGMPSFPWRTIANAQAHTPGAWPIYLSNTGHHVPVNFVLNQIRRVETVRGGATVVAP